MMPIFETRLLKNIAKTVYGVCVFYGFCGLYIFLIPNSWAEETSIVFFPTVYLTILYFYTFWVLLPIGLVSLMFAIRFLIRRNWRAALVFLIGFALCILNTILALSLTTV